MDTNRLPSFIQSMESVSSFTPKAYEYTGTYLKAGYENPNPNLTKSASNPWTFIN